MRRERLAPWLVLLVAVGAYANTLWAGFVWDDRTLIVDEPMMQTPLAYARQLFLGGERWWRPLQRLSLLVDRSLWGVERPAGFHLTNVLLHALVCLALWRVAARVGLRTLGATVAALVFALHPVHVEAVANISHRKELLALLFYLAGLAAYAAARSGEEAAGPLVALARRLGLAVGARAARLELFGWSYVCCLLAMLSKEAAAVMFPILVGLWELLFGPEREWRRRLLGAGRFLAPFVLILAVFWTRGYLGTLPRRFSSEQILWITGGRTESYGVVLLTALKAFGESLRLLLAPWPLYLDRRFPLARAWSEPAVLASAAALAAYLAALAASRRRSPRTLFSLAWLGLNLLPVINVVPLTYWLVAERFLYVPSVGIALLAGIGAEALRRSVGRASGRAALAGIGALLALFAVLTVRQNAVWADESALWSNTLRRHPASAHGNYGYGLVLRREGDLEGAEAHFRRAFEASPSWTEPRYALALLLWDEGRYAAALKEVREVRRIDPEDGRALLIEGHASFRLGRWGRAAQAYRGVVAREPENLDARFNLALSLARSGHLRSALAEVRRLLARGGSADARELERALVAELAAGGGAGPAAEGETP